MKTDEDINKTMTKVFLNAGNYCNPHLRFTKKKLTDPVLHRLFHQIEAFPPWIKLMFVRPLEL